MKPITVEQLETCISTLSPFEKYAKDYYNANNTFLPATEIPGEFLTTFPISPTNLRYITGITSHSESTAFSFPLTETYLERNFFTSDSDIFIQKQPCYSISEFTEHQFYLINYVYSGSCKEIFQFHGTTETVELKTGDFIFVPPYLHYATEINTDSVLLNIGIRASSFSKSFSHNIPAESIFGNFFSTSSDQPGSSLQYIIFHAQNDSVIHKLIQDLAINYCNTSAYSSNITNLQLSLLFMHLLENHSHTMQISGTHGNLSHSVPAILHYIEHSNEVISVSHIAHVFGYSEDYLNTIFKKVTAHTLSDVIRNMKMQKAGTLLKNTDLPVYTISTMLGYKDPTNLIRNFKKHYGITPAQYRKKL